MAYTPPLYNLNADVWLIDGTIKPSAGPADITGLVCQKYLPSRGMWDLTPPWSAGFYLAWHPPVHLRFPRSSPFAGAWPTWKVVCVEVPSGSGQYYRAYWADIQHEGFTNEYVEWVGVQCDADLKAIPPAGGSQPTGVGADAGGFTPAAVLPAVTLPPGPFPGSGSPVTVFIDTFTDTATLDLSSHVSNSGVTWTQGSGQIQIDASGVGAIGMDLGGTASWYVANYGGSYTTNIILDFVTPGSLFNGIVIGVIFRATDANNWLAAILSWDGVSSFDLGFYDCVAGTTSLLQAGTPFTTLTASVAHSIMLQFAGASITATLFEGTTPVRIETFSSATGLTNPKIGIYTVVTATIPTVLITGLTR